MAEAAAMNLPQGLGMCGNILGLDESLLKKERGAYLIQKLCIPQKSRAKVQPPRWNNDPALMQELFDYCKQDVVAEMAITKKLHRLSPYEQAAWVKTQEINLRGVPVDTAEIANIIKCTDAELERLNNELKILTDYQVTDANKRQAVQDWCNVRLPEDLQLPDLTGDTVTAWLKRTLPAPVRRALEIRAMGSQTSVAKLDAMLATAAPDGTLKQMLAYHGASTGRFASRGGVNLQNIARPSLKDDEIAIAHDTLGTGDYELASMVWGERLMDAGVSTARGVLKAKPGYRFLDADLASVENRVASWISGQTDKVEMFAKGLDEYKVFASEGLYLIPYESVTKDQRQVSKSACLGAMFGQGAKGLIEYAEGYGVTLDLKRSKEIVDLYRAKYHMVQACWHACGRASIMAVEAPGVWQEVNDKIALAVNKSMSFLVLRLPSGRIIRWAMPRVEVLETPWGEMRAVVTVEQTDSFTRKWKRDKLIGSSIFQSAVQATARDIQVFGLMTAEAAGYNTVLLVHDEILCHNKVGWGSPEELGRLICIQPEWAQDLPLAFEGWESDRFHK
jgi:DNA polymerase